jgi:hypothetical protein
MAQGQEDGAGSRTRRPTGRPRGRRRQRDQPGATAPTGAGGAALVGDSGRRPQMHPGHRATFGPRRQATSRSSPNKLAVGDDPYV